MRGRSIHYVMSQIFSALRWQRASQHDCLLWRVLSKQSKYFCCLNIDRKTKRNLQIEFFSFTFSQSSGHLMSSLGVPFKSWVRMDRNIAGDLEGQIKEPIMIESSNKPLLHLRQLGQFFFFMSVILFDFCFLD